MTHLGERVSALLDGQLGPEATERAMSHLAGCRDCRDAVEIERLTKARLACLSGPEPAGDLVSRLLAMGGPAGPLPPRPGHVPGSPRPRPVPLEGPVPSRVPVTASALVPVMASALRPAGPGRLGSLRPRASRGTAASARPPAGRAATGPGRPAGPARSVQRARLAGAVLGALGVVGAGVGGLILTAPAASLAGAGGLTGAGGVASLSVQQAPLASPTLTARGPRFVPALAPSVPVYYHRGGR